MPKTKDRTVEEKNLLAAGMWSIFNFGDINERYSKFLARGRPMFKSLIESVLLYDRIFIPTQDFLSLTILVGVLGERSVLNLLEADRLRFLRLKGSLAYIGNGGGIQALEEIKSPEGKSHAFSAPVEAAVSWSLSGLAEKPKDPLLPRLVVKATQEIDIKSFVDEIRHETYMDILNSPYLQDVFAIHDRDMNKLPGIEPTGVRIYGGPDGNWRGDEIDILMALSATNVELLLAQSVNCLDASTASPVGHLLKAKAERSFGKSNAEQALVILREIAGIPDLGEGILEKQITTDRIVKLAQSRNGTQFREWFHKNCRESSLAVAREYVALLQETPRIQSFPARVMRFITTTAIGSLPLIGQTIGVVVGVVDSFFIEKWLRGSSPKFFIEDLRQIQGKT